MIIFEKSYDVTAEQEAKINQLMEDCKNEVSNIKRSDDAPIQLDGSTAEQYKEIWHKYKKKILSVVESK